MMRLGIEPRSLGPLTNALLIRPWFVNGLSVRIFQRTITHLFAHNGFKCSKWLNASIQPIDGTLKRYSHSESVELGVMKMKE